MLSRFYQGIFGKFNFWEVKTMKKQMVVLILIVFALILINNSHIGDKQGETVFTSENLTPDQTFKIWEKRIDVIKNSGKLPIIDTQATYGNEIDVPFIM